MNRISIFLVLLFLALLPLVSGEYFVNLGSQILIAVIFASSLNLLVGYAGLTSLGHASYLGLSAYISALLSIKMGLGHSVTAPASLLLTTLIGMVSVTNGDNGLSGLIRPHPFGIDLDISNNFYWFALAITSLCIYMIQLMIRSPFGASIRGTRDQARRMSALGYNVWAIRWTTFVIASFLGAVSGLLYVYFHKYIHPSVMAITVSAEALLCVIAGGAGTLVGPLLGALVVVVLKNYASAYVERWNMLLGMVFLIIVIFMPAGLVSASAVWKDRFKAVDKP
jgi:branched-chain amino acid transport system permease protein